MSNLNELFKVLAEGKKDYEENNPVGKKIKEAKVHVQEDLGSLFAQLASLKEELVTVSDNIIVSEEQLIDEASTLIAEETLTEEIPLQTIPSPESIPTPEERVDGMKYDIDKYLRGGSFQQPNPDTVSQNVDDIRAKIKFLEQAIGKIAATGPGSGEVNFRYLDDVNRITMTPSNDNWVLEYDVETKKVQFTEHIGPIRSIKFNTTGPQQALVPGQIAWNPVEDCLDIRNNDGTTLQSGLENHIRVHNHSASAMDNGTVVMFAGVENTDTVAMPIIGKYIADSSASPLFLIGVLTTDIPSLGIGRATTFGYVRDLNTTGADVGETWVQGDLLWGHPTMPGKMTKVRPTAPNVATSIAAVAKVGTTDGQLLVRPTIWPRLYYGDWYDLTNQTVASPLTAYPVKLGYSGDISGFTINAGKTEIKALNSGRYNFEFSLQITSTNSSLARMWIWYRKNGVDAPNSATVVTVRENGGKLAPAWNFPVLMNANDTFTLMWATESVNVSIAHEPATAFCPAIPSVILTVSQTNL